MRRSVASVAAAVALLAGACGGDDGRKAGEGASSARTAAEGLCEAELLASGGDVEGARTAFEDQAHTYLHDLAGRLQERDRALAGQLLEAKERVEATLRSPTDPAVLAGLIGGLRAVMEAGAALVGSPVVGCPR